MKSCNKNYSKFPSQEFWKYLVASKKSVNDNENLAVPQIVLK